MLLSKRIKDSQSQLNEIRVTERNRRNEAQGRP